MSFCESMISYSGKRIGATENSPSSSSKKKKKRGGTRQFFHIWKRVDSDSLRYRLLDLLGYRQSWTPFETFSAIEELSPLEPLERYARNRQALALFSKDEDMVGPIDKRAAALQSFLDSERSCKDINERFRNGSFAQGDVAHIIWYAQRKIASILGDVPEISELELSFGSGASTSCSNNKVSARWKLSNPPSISNSAVTALQALIRTLPAYFKFHKKVEVHDGKLDFVPKNYKTMRSICIEPTVNVMVQRGIGTHLKRKLKVAGIDLYDQSINRRRARQGSLTGTLATIDLEKASDSVSYLLVMELLPWDWFHLLDTYRTPTVNYEKSKIHLEKFSSMGNGFTFELESLIFYSLAFGVAKHFNIPFDVTVYGDDIVVNTTLATSLRIWLPIFGFSVNSSKSYFDGPFRESCGGDFVNGVDVRPFYLKGRFSYHKVVCFYNFLVRKPQLDPDGLLRQCLLEHVPEKYRLWGLDGYGDGHFVTDSPTCLTPYGRKRGFSGYTFKSFVSVPHRNTADCSGDPLLPSYVASLYSERRSMLGAVSSNAPDHLSVRRLKEEKLRSKKVNIYVLGPTG